MLKFPSVPIPRRRRPACSYNDRIGSNLFNSSTEDSPIDPVLFEETAQAWTGRSGRVGLTEPLKGLRRSWLDDLIVGEEAAVDSAHVSYSTTCVQSHPGFCSSTVPLESPFF